MLFSFAVEIARKAHDGQVRKYTGEPYLTHPFAVAGIVASVTNDEEMIIAAILHDIVEDSHFKIHQIGGFFGQRIMTMVSDLTDVSVPEDGNRAVRKNIDLLHTAGACAEAKTIKLADLIDNSKTIIPYGKGFACKYMKEKDALMKVLTEGDPELYKLADNMIKNYWKTVGRKV